MPSLTVWLRGMMLLLLSEVPTSAAAVRDTPRPRGVGGDAIYSPPASPNAKLQSLPPVLLLLLLLYKGLSTVVMVGVGGGCS